MEIQLIVNLLVAALSAAPQVISLIENAQLPQQTKDELIAQIKAAQANLPIWE